MGLCLFGDCAFTSPRQKGCALAEKPCNKEHYVGMLYGKGVEKNLNFNFVELLSNDILHEMGTEGCEGLNSQK